MSKILSKNYDLIEQVFGKGLMNFLVPIILNVTYHNLLKEALILLKQVTDDFNLEILTLLSTDTSFIPNLVMLISNNNGEKNLPDNILTLIFGILSNLGHLPEVQSNHYVIKSALPVILKMYQKDDGDIEMRIEAAKCLRQFCESRSNQMKTQIEALQINEVIIECLATSKIQNQQFMFYSQLTLLQLQNISNNSLVETDISLFSNLFTMKKLNPLEKLLYSRTLSSFAKNSTQCKDFGLLKIQENLIQNCLEIIKQVGQVSFSITPQTQKDAIDNRLNSLIISFSMEALKHFSLHQNLQIHIFNNLTIILPYIEGLFKKFEVFQDILAEDLNPLISVNNCLMSREVRKMAQIAQKKGQEDFEASIFERYYDILLKYHQIEEQVVIRHEAFKKEIIQNIEIECTLALTLVDGTVQEVTTTEGGEESKANYLIHVLKTQKDQHMLCKVLSALTLICVQNTYFSQQLLSPSFATQTLQLLHNSPQPSVLSLLFTLLSTLLTAQHGFLFSLPLSSNNFTLNLAAPEDYHLAVMGEPTCIQPPLETTPSGVLFDDIDALKVIGKPPRPREWTIIAQVQIPPTKSSNDMHVLVGGEKNRDSVIHLMIRCQKGVIEMGSRGDDGGVVSEVVSRRGKGEHQLAATYDGGCVRYYLDGKMIGVPQKVQIKSAIKYIGNSAEGRNPFGQVHNLQILNRVIDAKEISQARMDKSATQNFFQNIIDDLLNIFNKECSPIIISSLSRLLSKLVMNQDFRKKFLIKGCLQTTYDLMTVRNLPSHSMLELQRILLSLH